MRLAIATATLAIALAIPALGSAQEQSRPVLSDMTEAEREAFRTEVRAYLLEYPEVLMEAINILEARRKADTLQADAALIAASSEQLYNDPHSWVSGNPEGDVTLVEFLDYRCGYCKKAHPEVQELLKRDPNIRLVVKEFPIRGAYQRQLRACPNAGSARHAQLHTRQPDHPRLSADRANAGGCRRCPGGDELILQFKRHTP
jgi:protein-disulfide isomerase